MFPGNQGNYYNKQGFQQSFQAPQSSYYGEQEQQGYDYQQEERHGRPPMPPGDQYYEDQAYSRPSGPPPGNHGSQGESYGKHAEQRFDEQNYQTEQQEYSQMGQYHHGNHYSKPSNHELSFGVEGYNYQYSNCTGKKKALFVGINYIGTSNQLNGCINDCNNVKQFLLSQGFEEGDMVMLKDDNATQRSIPTKRNILDAIGWLVKDAQPNDSLFFHYSGHGGQTNDRDGDEVDGYDEVIYPLDFEVNGFISDDELHERLVRPLPQGCRLTALFDSCHSGSVIDLPFMYSTKGVVKEPNLLEEAGEGLFDAFKAYSRGDQKAVFKGLTSIVKSVLNKDKSEQANEITKKTKTSPADAILLSGCKDSQTSADTQENGQSTGAMSYAFISVMKANSNQSYLSLLQNMRKILAEKYSQKPQLSASHPIDVNLQFIV